MHESIILIRTPRWRRRPKADRPSLWSLWSLWRQLQKQRARLRGDRTHGWGILRDLILVFWLGPTSGCWSLVHPQFFDRNRRRSDESCRIFAYWCEGVVNVHCKGLFCCYKKTSNKKPEKELWMESKLPVVSHSNLRFCRHRRKFVDSIDSIETPKMLLSKSLSFPHKKEVNLFSLLEIWVFPLGKSPRQPLHAGNCHRSPGEDFEAELAAELEGHQTCKKMCVFFSPKPKASVVLIEL